MAHRSNKEIYGDSDQICGVILDEPNEDDNNPFVHTVYGNNKVLYYIPKEVYNRYMNSINNNRENDVLRMMEERCSFGQNIKFKYKYNQATGIMTVTDFNKGAEDFITVVEDSNNFFKVISIFNEDCSSVYSSEFETVDCSIMKNQPLLATPNTQVYCYYTFKIDQINHKIDFIFNRVIPDFIESLDCTNIAYNAPWGKICLDPDDFDEDVYFEHTEKNTYDTRQKLVGFITGLNTIYVPELPYLSFVLPTYRPLPQHHIGSIIKCDVVFNDVKKCYIPFNKIVNRACTYETLIYNSEIFGVYAHFKTFLRIRDFEFGFYDHPFFGLVYDPDSVLDLIYSLPKYENSVMTTLVQDKFGLENMCYNTRDHGFVTRIEIVDMRNKEQRELIKKLKNHRLKISSIEGYVLNAETGRVFVRSYPTAEFYIKTNITVATGEVIKIIESVRVRNEIEQKPTFEITDCKIEQAISKSKYDPQAKKFIVQAQYHRRSGCYKSYEFGYIPIKADTKITEYDKDSDKYYSIEAEEGLVNEHQTVLINAVLHRSDYR